MRLQHKWSKTHRTPGGEVQTKQTPNEGLLAERAWLVKGAGTSGASYWRESEWKGETANWRRCKSTKSHWRFTTHECQHRPI